VAGYLGAWYDIGARAFLRIRVGSLNAAMTRPIDTRQPHLNRCDVILLNPAKHPVPKQTLAQRFARWLLSAEGQAAIGAYKVDGQQLFHPSAAAPK
jgi:ABC-type tungstate transport system permease subunit